MNHRRTEVSELVRSAMPSVASKTQTFWRKELARNRLVRLTAALIVVLSVPLYAGGGSEDATTGEAAAVESGEPQYGGTITVLNFLADSLGVPDPAYGSGTTQAKNIVGERIQVGDVHKYGARGTGDFLFTDDAGLPLPYKTGGVIDSWEATADKLTLHVRPGIVWTGLSINDVMEKREVTADDVVMNYRRRFDEASGSGGYIRGIDWIKKPEVDNVYAVGTDTVVFETNYFHADWDGILQGGGGQLCPRELRSESSRQTHVGEHGWHRAILGEGVCSWFPHDVWGQS